MSFLDGLSRKMAQRRKAKMGKQLEKFLSRYIQEAWMSGRSFTQDELSQKGAEFLARKYGLSGPEVREVCEKTIERM